MKTSAYATNKRARHDYEILDTYLAGIVLAGHEVKSIRTGNANLKGSYVTISKDNEAWLTNSHITKYQHAGNIGSYDPERSRKLLLQRSEIDKLIRARNSKYVIVALSLVAAGPNIKLRLATARSKKLHDKRSSIQKRDVSRDANRELKQSQKK